MSGGAFGIVRDAPDGAATSLRRGRLAARPFGVAVGHRHDAGRWRRWRDRLDDQRPGQPGRPPLAGRGSQVRPRQDDARVGEPGQVRRRDARRERRQQGVLVLLGRGRSAAHQTLTRVERAERLEPVAGRRRPAVAELGPSDRRDPPPDRALGRRRRRARSATAARRTRGGPPAPSRSVARRRAGASRPVRPTCRRGSARSARTGSGAGSSMTKTPGPWAGTGRPQTAGPSAIRPTERRSEAAPASRVIGRWYRRAGRAMVRPSCRTDRTGDASRSPPVHPSDPGRHRGRRLALDPIRRVSRPTDRAIGRDRDRGCPQRVGGPGGDAGACRLRIAHGATRPHDRPDRSRSRRARSPGPSASRSHISA